jgi:hypothetical protein
MQTEAAYPDLAQVHGHTVAVLCLAALLRILATEAQSWSQTLFLFFFVLIRRAFFMTRQINEETQLLRLTALI